MFAGRFQSALFVDFDNMIGGFSAEFPRRVDHWLTWLESGGFDPKSRRRRFVAKRVYWNYHNRKYAEVFEPRGFETFTCLKRTQTDKTNLADMMIALDALELAFQNPRIQEYVILSADTDFVALMDKLSDRSVRTVAFEKDQTSMREFESHADHVITAATFRAAFDFPLREPSWRDRLFNGRAAGDANAEKAAPTPAPVVAAEAVAAYERAGRRRKSGGDDDPRMTPRIREAIELLRSLAQKKNWRILGRKSVNAHLRERVPGYETTGARPYLGLKSYENFIGLIAETQTDFDVQEDQNSGLTLRYRG